MIYDDHPHTLPSKTVQCPFLAGRRPLPTDRFEEQVAQPDQTKALMGGASAERTRPPGTLFQPLPPAMRVRLCSSFLEGREKPRTKSDPLTLRGSILATSPFPSPFPSRRRATPTRTARRPARGRRAPARGRCRHGRRPAARSRAPSRGRSPPRIRSVGVSAWNYVKSRCQPRQPETKNKG